MKFEMSTYLWGNFDGVTSLLSLMAVACGTPRRIGL